MSPETYFIDHLLIAIAALLANALLGGPRSFYQPWQAYLPTRQLAAGIRFLEKRLNRDRRPAEERRVRGMILMVMLMMSMLFLGMALSMIARAFPYGVAVEIICVTMLVSLRSSYDRAAELSRALAEDDLELAREALDGTAWRNSALLDAHGLARATIEMLAMHFAQKVVAPVVWYMLLGLPGIFASRMLTLLNEVLAQNGAQRETFGWSAHEAYKWCMAAPNTIAAGALGIASLVSPTAKPRQAWKALSMQFEEPSLESASLAPVPVMAAATEVALGGPASVFVGGDWVGRGTLRPYPADIRKAIFIYILACVLVFLLLAVLA